MNQTSGHIDEGHGQSPSTKLPESKMRTETGGRHTVHNLVRQMQMGTTKQQI